MNNKAFNNLKAGLKDIVAYKKGKLDLRSDLVIMPEPPTDYKAKEIKKIRQKGCYSQSVFSGILNVSVKTVQSWESGQRVPNSAALRLLELVDKGIYRPDICKKV